MSLDRSILGEKRMGEIFFEQDHLIIREPSGKPFFDIPVKDIEALELGETRRASVGDVAAGAFALGVFGAAAAAMEKIPTLKISYSTTSGLKSSITLGMDSATYLARKIESLRR